MNYEEADMYCIFKFVSGSHAYGFNVPESDQDLRGVFMAPLKHHFDINSEEGLDTKTVHKPGADDEMHELSKFMKLAADCNPNIIEYLYVNRLILGELSTWTKVRDHRHLFLSKKAKFTFSGYAIAQLKRIKTHRGYLLNPPTKKPERKDYNLPEDSKMPKEVRNLILSMDTTWFSGDTRELAQREKDYTLALNEYRSYEEWKKNRNKARKGMEEKYGYDLKHATHLVRLINMCKEILTEGTLSVYRPERELLMSIRQGEWPFEKLEAFALESDMELEELYNKSTLRDKPDRKGIQQLYYDICEEYYGIKLHAYINRELII